MELTIKDFIEMEELDHQYFPDDNITSAEEAFKWYLFDPNSCIIIKEEGKVVAYLNILSLKEDIYNQVKFNRMNESQIKTQDLELSKDKYLNYLYFPAIVVHKDFRNLKVLMKLINRAKQHLKSLANKYSIKEVMADCSTKEGAKITERILKLKPFMKTSHGSVIHVLDGRTFVRNLN